MKFHYDLAVSNSLRQFALDGSSENGHGSVLVLGGKEEGAERSTRCPS